MQAAYTHLPSLTKWYLSSFEAFEEFMIIVLAINGNNFDLITFLHLQNCLYLPNVRCIVVSFFCFKTEQWSISTISHFPLARTLGPLRADSVTSFPFSFALRLFFPSMQ